MAKYKTKADEYKAIFVKLHKHQAHGADNLIALLTRHIKGKAEYMASYIELVAERSGVSPTGHITTTNADIMIPIVSCMESINTGSEPCHKDVVAGWNMYIEEYRNNKIKL